MPHSLHSKIDLHAEIFGTIEAEQVLRGIAPSTPDPFDRDYGTDTETPVPAPAAELPASVEGNAVVYVPTRTALARHVLQSLPIRFEDYSFVDIGSGKGRVVMLAAEHPFRAVVGVEPSPRHMTTALENLGRFRAAGPPLRASSVTYERTDIASYELPAGPLVLFLYNPFQEIVARLFVMMLDSSIRATPRDVLLVYCQPVVGARALGTSTTLSLVSQHRCLLEECGWNEYRALR